MANLSPRKIFLVLSITFFLHAEQGDVFKIGVGLGVQSYPASLDPNEMVVRYPVLYPQLSLNTEINGKTNIITDFSLVTVDAGLLPILCRQTLVLNLCALGVDYNLGTEKDDFKIGIQFLTTFSRYTIALSDKYHSAGIGVKLSAAAGRPLISDCWYEIRLGVQRLSFDEILPWAGSMNLNSVNIEIFGYLPF